MSFPCATSNHPIPAKDLKSSKAQSTLKAQVAAKDTSNKLDIVIVDPSKRDKCLVEKGPALVEKAWIMSRPPAELLLDQKLVTARKMQLVRDLINCWTGEYTRVVAPPPPPPIRNCDRDVKKNRYCMMYSVNNCSKDSKGACVYEP